MTTRWWCASVAVLVLALTTGEVPQGQGASVVDHVNPRPRLLFAPGEYGRFVGETTGVRRNSFDQLIAEIDSRGTGAWNERDLRLESQALVARVLIDRGDGRGQTYLGYARHTLQQFLAKHAYTQFPDSHDLPGRNVPRAAAVRPSAVLPKHLD